MSDLNDKTRTSFDKAVPFLTKGILDMYMMDLLPAKLQINELNKKSSILNKEATEERARFQAVQNSDDIKDFIFKFQFYKKKLCSIKTKMTDMNRKITVINDKMKRIQQNQEYEIKRKSMLREREEQLIGTSPALDTQKDGYL